MSTSLGELRCVHGGGRSDVIAPVTLVVGEQQVVGAMLLKRLVQPVDLLERVEADLFLTSKHRSVRSGQAGGMGGHHAHRNGSLLKN